MLSQLGSVLDAFNFFTIILMVFGVFGGLIVGALPGLTSTMAVALLVPITYGMDINHGLVLLVAVYIGGIAGGLVSASLLNIPGTPACVATTFDAYPMAKQGYAGRALSYGIFSAFLGGMFSFFCLVLLAPPLSSFALDFGPCEYFALVFFTLSCIVSISQNSLIKGFISGSAGLLLSCVGLSETDGMPRFDFGIDYLQSGFNVMPVLIGMFAVSQILVEVKHIYDPYNVMGANFSQREFWGVAKNVFGHWKNVLRSALIGTGIGILPGIGPGLSNIVAYLQAKSASKTPESFGTGNPEGIIASETASCASTGGAMIPLLTLGIPGDATTMMMLGAFMLQGVQPGPLLMRDNPQLIMLIYIAFFISVLLMLLMLINCIRLMVKALMLPREILYPVIVMLCVIGCYALNSSMFDVWVFFGMGLLGTVMAALRFPLLPLVLGLMLGRMAETQLRISITLGHGTLSAFLERPIAMLFIAASVFSVCYSLYRANKTRKTQAVA
jgi:putative tricarboxylic transport membrane protein